MISGLVIYFNLVTSSDLIIGVLLIIAFYTIAIMISSIATVVAPDSFGADATVLLEVFGSLGLIMTVINNKGEQIGEALSEMASVVVFFGMIVLIIVGLQFIFRMNSNLGEMLRATDRPKAFKVLLVAFGLSYIVIIWISFLPKFDT
jgi:hypothetical protein